MLRAIALHGLSHAVRASGRGGGIGGLGIALYRRGMSLLARLALGGMLAAVGAILIGAVATSGGLVQLLVTGFAAMALWIPAFLLVSRIARWRRRRRRRRERAALADRSGPPSDIRTAEPLHRIDAAWSSLAVVAGERRSDVRRIERQLAAVWRSLPAQSLDPQVHELKLLIGGRIPQLIDTQLSCLPLRGRERGSAIDGLLDLLGEFTDDSVRRYERIADSGRTTHEVVRRRIEDHIGRGGLSPLN